MEEKALPVLPFERIAMAGGEMPDDLEWFDRTVFLQLRMLYHQHRNGLVDRETASREKRRLLEDREFHLFQDNLVNDLAKRVMETEKARQEYRKNRTLENADAIILAFEGVPVTFNEETL